MIPNNIPKNQTKRAQTKLSPVTNPKTEPAESNPPKNISLSGEGLRLNTYDSASIRLDLLIAATSSTPKKTYSAQIVA